MAKKFIWANAKATHIFFSKNISVNALFIDESFNHMLTNDIICFEQLSPGVFSSFLERKSISVPVGVFKTFSGWQTV